MTITEKLIAECERRGVRLEPHDDKILIEPPENTTPELVEEIRAHKFAIIASLEAKRRAALLHICRQVLDGEFCGCDAVVAERLAAQLFKLPPSFCRNAALVRLGEEVSRQ